MLGNKGFCSYVVAGVYTCLVLCYLCLMFISKKRTKKNPNVYVQLIESYRNSEGKVRQKVIKHIGSAATDENL